VDAITHCNNRTLRTKPETEDLLDFHPTQVLGGLPHLSTTARLTGISAADPHQGRRRWGRAQIAVEADDTVDLGGRHVERFRQQVDGATIDVAHLVLDRLQSRQEAALHPRHVAHDGPDHVR